MLFVESAVILIWPLGPYMLGRGVYRRASVVANIVAQYSATISDSPNIPQNDIRNYVGFSLYIYIYRYIHISTNALYTYVQKKHIYIYIYVTQAIRWWVAMDKCGEGKVGVPEAWMPKD